MASTLLDASQGPRFMPIDPHERPGGTFLRQFNLGEGISTETISANYDNGC